MRNACYYLVEDARVNPHRAVSAVCRVTEDHGQFHIENALSGGSVFDVPDGHPDYVDDEDTGLIVLPRPDGMITLRLPSAQDFEALAPEYPSIEWPILEDEEQIQEWLVKQFFSFDLGGH